MDIPLIKMIRFAWFSLMGTMLHLMLPPVRVVALRALGAHIGKGCVILDCSFFNAYHYGFTTLTIGDHCFIGDEVMIDLRGKTVLEDMVTVSNRVSLVTHMNVGFPDHPLQHRYPTKESHIHLKKGCYIGLGAIILPGVTVGEESVVGAGAVVTHDIPKSNVAVGVPAKVMK
jgi:acetyltransferase-like isoleucine patch superfamily enzyme